jgi:hypothetical protein
MPLVGRPSQDARISRTVLAGHCTNSPVARTRRLPSLFTRNRPDAPKFDRRPALVRSHDEILAWEQRKETEEDTSSWTLLGLCRNYAQNWDRGLNWSQVDVVSSAPPVVLHHLVCRGPALAWSNGRREA